MTYSLRIEATPITVIELPSFTRAVVKIWSEDERAKFTDYIARNPEAGALVPGTGGHRKVRWAIKGRGKRGGARVIYFFMVEDRPIYLTAIYAKNEKDNVSPAERHELQAIAATMKAMHAKDSQ